MSLNIQSNSGGGVISFPSGNTLQVNGSVNANSVNASSVTGNNLHSVAYSGDYNALNNKPAISSVAKLHCSGTPIIYRNANLNRQTYTFTAPSFGLLRLDNAAGPTSQASALTIGGIVFSSNLNTFSDDAFPIVTFMTAGQQFVVTNAVNVIYAFFPLAA